MLNDFNQYKILMVDDRRENLISLGAVLKNAGYSTDAALSGKEALGLLLKNKYGLIILDVQMPEMNGFELAEYIKGSNSTKHIPLIFLSANAIQSDYYKKGYEAGALDYLAKPVDESMLLLKVRNFLQLHHSTILLEKLNKQLEKKAVHATISYQDLYSSLSQDIFLINKDGFVVNINKRDFLQCGLAVNEFLNKPFWKTPLLNEIIGSSAQASNFQNFIDYSTESKSFEFKFEKTDKSIFYGDVHITSAIVGGKLNVQVTITDATEKKLAEEKIKLHYNEILNSEKINRAILNGDSLEDISNRLLYTLEDIAGIITGRVYLYDNQHHKLNLLSNKIDQQAEKELENLANFPIKNAIPSLQAGSLFNSVISEKLYLITSDEGQINRLLKEHSDETELQEAVNWAQKFMNIQMFGVLPLIMHDHVLGLITFASTKVLPEAAIQTIIRFSQQAATVLSKKISELELKESEERFELAMRGANDGLWDWNLLTDEVYYSPRWKSMLGFKETDIEGNSKVWQQLLHEEDKKNVFDSLSNYFSGEAKEYSIEYRMKHKDGYYLNILSRGIGVKNESGQFKRMIGIHTDITERKEIETKLLQSELQIRNFAKYLNRVMEDQRTNLAREIHDELGQELAGIKFGISSLKKIAANNPEAETKIANVLNSVDATIQSLRKIATELRPGILDSLGLAASIEWLVKEFHKKTNIVCKTNVNVHDHPFSKDISTCFFRICQEALSNISKHAEASELAVRLLYEDEVLTLIIADNGKGIDTSKQNNPFSMGLLGMRERAHLIGGHLEIHSALGEGTLIKTFIQTN